MLNAIGCICVDQDKPSFQPLGRAECRTFGKNMSGQLLASLKSEKSPETVRVVEVNGTQCCKASGKDCDASVFRLSALTLMKPFRNSGKVLCQTTTTRKHLLALITKERASANH